MKERQMPTITFVNPDGTREDVAATNGDSAMQAATMHGVHGIVAECGGNAMCATCHVYVDEGWLGRLPTMSSDEDALLDGTAADRRSNSRLSCQIRIDPELDGLVLQLPERQV
jgi:2Fe-2S ferredoxin